MADSKTTALTELTTAIDTDIMFCVDDPGVTPLDRSMTMAVLRAAIGTPTLLHAVNQQATTVDGGGVSATTWNILTLNTLDTNLIAGASLASNKVTLPAGTYRVRAHCPFYKVSGVKMRVWNDSDSSVEITGGNNYTSSVDGSQVNGSLFGEFTLAAAKDIELQAYTTSTQASNGQGIQTGDGTVERYAEVWIEQVST